MITEIYEGCGWGRELIGEYDGNTIYSGHSWNRSIVEHLKKAEMFKDLVGPYEDDDSGAVTVAFLFIKCYSI